MNHPPAAHKLKLLPSVHEMAEVPSIKEAQQRERLPAGYVKKLIREQTARLREQIASNKDHSACREEMKEKITVSVIQEMKKDPFLLRPLVNATGTVLHTNLGRSRLSPEAAAHVVETAVSYSTLEYDISSGRRGSRLSLLEGMLAEVTGAEAAMVVNNNAAAVFLTLAALAKHKETIVSRGELVEIGGSFRVSSIMEESGTILSEVGTTNKTRVSDYLQSVTENTAMVMKVHTSNFAMVGFTESVPSSVLRKELNAAGRENVIVYDDLGSGSLYPYSSKNIGEEPVVRRVLEEGTDLVSFSGDKLLGGPQAGVIAGKRDLIDKLKKHQLARVLRLDKLTIAALEATLFEYLYGEHGGEKLPAVRDITKTREQIRQFTEECAASLNLKQVRLIPAPSFSKIGGGTMPLEELPTYGLFIESKGRNAAFIERFFRLYSHPVIGRISDDCFYLDMRTVEKEDWEHVAGAVKDLDKL